MSKVDFTILTEQRYNNPKERDDYVNNVLLEDRLLLEALELKGFTVERTYWDDPSYDWNSTKYIIFRTTWDYFDRFEEFSKWLEMVNSKTLLINSKDFIYWNIDKHYLKELESEGVRIPPTIYIEKGDVRTLEQLVRSVNWKEYILKPVISGAARHTYKFSADGVEELESVFAELIQNESMMLQEYQYQISTKGEVSYMLFGGKFSHAVLKKAKPGDFRVQDDFGGTIEHYHPSQEEINFAESAVKACKEIPVYARADVFWNNDDELVLGELELIEPELWFRMNDTAADLCAKAIDSFINS